MHLLSTCVASVAGVSLFVGRKDGNFVMSTQILRGILELVLCDHELIREREVVVLELVLVES